MALYRKYRPAAFAEVVGQEHVTEPLSAALESGRINHAYLFSGPRGCGKTSSARILARSLNCVEGPTATPCGVCRSCVALGPGGAGNLDVVELDAASHGGVDDTRDLRDKAFYAPAESRYRVFIVDEAHMVTNAGFNALLKIVEEPPEHLIFVFATTEPEKVLPTIRSRTHHYPFRLLPPMVMRGLLDRICEQEHVTVEDAVYPLVIRAGGGSPRDTLSVLDQLLAGAGPEGITYGRALALLGVTDVALIDDAVDALAVDDGAAIFETVNRLIEAGLDPRRFASDLLDRLRDLIVLRAVPDAGERGLVDAPGDALERMREEAERIGPATLTRYAEVVHDSLTDMRGATAPRLLLEVMCARLLLPAASDESSAMLQRIERLERGGGAGVAAPAGSAGAGAAAVSGSPAGGAPESGGSGEERPVPRFVRPSQRRATQETAPPRHDPPQEKSAVPEPTAPQNTAPAPVPTAPVIEEPAVAEPAVDEPTSAVATAEQPDAPDPAPVQSAPAGQADAPGPVVEDEPQAPEAPQPPEEQAAAGGRPDAVAVRAAWPEVRAAIRSRSRTVEVMLAEAVVKRVDDDVVVLAHPSPPLATRLAEPHNAQLIREAIGHVYGGEWRLAVENDSGPAQAGGPPQTTRAQRASRQAQAGAQAPQGYSRPSQAARAEPAPVRGEGAAPQGSAGTTTARSAEVAATPAGTGGSTPVEPGDGPQDAGAAAPRDEDAPPEEGSAPPFDEAAAEEEMMAEAAAGPGVTAERRDPEEAAVELLRGTLGATPIDE
ncbi:DNA polymerase III subunit gamma and tau [Tomitella gaofuii]|uniref:DNA polymerase III subunit gamma and tau n=1 Tax=Tomitella gaofuii TaxID=2760083 RepID=UPI0020BF470B|nr:DNA polymerase III subunit gamma and tau [Tomitella gaofuii]